MKKKALVVATCVALFGCQKVLVKKKENRLEILNQTSALSTPVETQQAQQAVIETLIDPESARFGDQTTTTSYTRRMTDGATGALNSEYDVVAVCGKVNAKNRFGGYTGFTDYGWITNQFGDGSRVLLMRSEKGSDRWLKEISNNALREACTGKPHL